MAELSLEQVKFIEKDIQKRGLKNDSLISDLVDHVCCILEDELNEDTKFEDLYPTIINRFFKKDLLEVEEETNLLLTFKNYYAMRNTMIRSGMSALILLVIGIIFKTLHLPGTAIILILATVLITFVFLPIFFVFNTKNSNPQKKMVIGFGALFGILFVLAALFRVLHWPGAILLWRSSLLVVTFLFLPAYLFGSIRNEENKTNVIITSLMILIMSGILWGMTIVSRTSVHVDQAIENQTLSLIDFSNSTKNLKSDELEKLNHLTSESKRLIIQIEEKLTREINKMENEKIDLKRSVSLYSNDIDISTNALFINDQPVNVLKQLKNNLFKINKLSGGQLFKTRINKNNWEVDNFSHLPLHMVVSYLQIIKIQLSIVVA
jgi:hypothetical protein